MLETPDKAKGLRFEVFPENVLRDGWGKTTHQEWSWQLVGADGPVCKSTTTFDTEKEARSHLQANKGRMGNAKRCKVITVEQGQESQVEIA